ncbi:MAG: T9SS type A sorting domain-containing protein [Crocinitomicaceae bacterium]|nr:T9SS type A sorting domain-containing protein [Crocinitomicaceae bacterium]
MKSLVLFISFSVIINLNLFAQSPGNSLHFDGTADNVSAGLPSVFTNIAANDFTFETWVKPNGATTQRIFFAQFNSTNFASVLLNSSNTPYVYVSNGTSYGLNTTSSLTTGVWSHFAFTWQASAQTILIYINGVEVTTASGGTSSTGVDNAMSIGSKTDGTQNLNGELDEFRIWDYVRTDCEIMSSMNTEFTIAQTGLIAYYNFNEGVAGGSNTGVTSLPDFTTNYNGTLNNFALTGSTSNWLSSGAVINSQNQTGAISGSTEIVDSCAADYLWALNGTTYNTSGVYTETLTSVLNGCDSIVTLDLTLNSVDNSVTQSGFSLTADEITATYQWLDCDNSYSALSGETSQTFDAASDGNYAVEVTSNGCIDTSTCFVISGIGFNENNNLNTFSVSPNPSTGEIQISIPANFSTSVLTVHDVKGRILQSIAVNSDNIVHLDLPEASGIYFITWTSENKTDQIKVIRE